MTVYRLNEDLWFPPPYEYEDHGVIAFGGDLSVARLLMAYKNGIFPWNNEDDPITWWCPENRMVLRPSEVIVSKSSRNILNRKKFEVRSDTAFESVIHHCQNVARPGQTGTWLSNVLKESMIEIHKLGYAHSIETYLDGKLVGGLYGLSFGKMFFGDSMFSLESNASKVAFITLCQRLDDMGFDLIDCQIHNDHLASLGAYEIHRSAFLNLIRENPIEKTLKGSWSEYF